MENNFFLDLNNFEPNLGGLTLTDKEFELISTLIYNYSGIHLTNEKKSLVISRLQKLLQKGGFSSFKEYYDYILNDKTGNALSNMIARITTNYTFFNRERAHFDFLTRVALPEIIKKLKSKNSNDIRIWSAGCSTGQEPYTIVMTMVEYFGDSYKNWSAGVLATDISNEVLTIAKTGIYPDEALESLPKYLKNKYFIPLKSGEWQIKPEIRKEVTFRRFNLMNEVYPFKKPFHVIFCRNVMIYFDLKTREELVKKFYDFIEPGGYLFIGHSETLTRNQSLFKYIQPAIYKKEG